MPKPCHDVYTQRMELKIQSYQPEKEYFFIEGYHINELSNHSDDPNISIARARVLPGVNTNWHQLTATSERYVILEGQGDVELGDEAPHRVFPTDVVLIPANIRQRITNTGHVDLVFLAICSPRFLAKNYAQLANEKIEGLYAPN